MGLSEIAIRKPVFTWMLMAALIVFGLLNLRDMGISLMPDADSPVVSVSVKLEGAAPQVMETQVVDPIESALLSVPGIKSLSSTARQGTCEVTVEFVLDKDINLAVQEIQTALARIQGRLPSQTEFPVVRKRNPEDRPIIWMSLSSTKFQKRELMDFVRDQIKDQFTMIDGVAEVLLGGYVDPNLRVWLSASKMRQLDLTVDDVLMAIEREHRELPAGRMELPEQEKSVRVMGEAGSVEEFGKILINRRGGAPNYKPIDLSDVARIEDSLADVRRISRTNGQPSIGIGIIKERGSNAVRVAHQVKDKMDALKVSLPNHLALSINFDSTHFIEESVNELLFTLLLSALLTALVCWMFLGSLSATFNVILAIPTSIIGSFIALHFFNFTLNTFTILALSLSIGIVVDDAIMVLENILRHREHGKSRRDSAVVGTREILFSALAASAAIVAIFLPVAFMKGMIGRFFFQFGITVSVAVVLSLLEALTLTPMRCSKFLDVSGRKTRLGQYFERLMVTISNRYQFLLVVVLRYPLRVLVLSTLFFILSLGLIQWIKQEFVPSQDQGMFMVRVISPAGSSLELTDKKVREVEQVLGQQKSVARYFATVGGFGGTESNSAMVFVTLKPIQDREADSGRRFTQQEIMTQLRQKLKRVENAKVILQDLSLSGLGRRGFPIEFSLRGPDYQQLVKLSQQVALALEKDTDIIDLQVDEVQGAVEIQVVPERQKASQHGVSVSDIVHTVNTMLGGVVAGLFTKDGKRYDIRVRAEASGIESNAAISQFRVRNNRGQLVELSQLVKINEIQSPLSISRTDRQRSIGLSANIASHASQATVLKRVAEITQPLLPENYYVVASGSSKDFEESMTYLVFALLLGVAIAYMVLASQFNSFVHPLTVLMALPFSISGALIALWIGGQSLNVYSMIGILLLMGIAKKNSILLVDFTNQIVAQGSDVKNALLAACPLRLRPILMTSFSTVAAALPAALNIGPGAESRMPMALAIIGGLLVSTFLTLLVVPCVYSLVAPEVDIGSIGSEKTHAIGYLRKAK